MKTQQEETLNKALDLIIESGADLNSLLKQDGLLKQLKKGLLERALQGELKDHLGYDKYERSEAATNNARNGVTKKNLLTEDGALELEVPRDRNGGFEPVLVPKRSTRIEGLDDKIISLYAKGMSVNDIKIQLEELYAGAEVSTSLISRITAEIMDEVVAWQNRSLESVYPIVFFDCLVVKVRQDKRIINKAVYVALGIESTGHKDILGLWNE